MSEIGLLGISVAVALGAAGFTGERAEELYERLSIMPNSITVGDLTTHVARLLDVKREDTE